MSIKLIELAKDLVLSNVSADEFKREFSALWESESEAGSLVRGRDGVGECLYIILGLAERYTSDAERALYELDALSLRQETLLVLAKYNFI